MSFFTRCKQYIKHSLNQQTCVELLLADTGVGKKDFAMVCKISNSGKLPIKFSKT